jgi:hypothetical protein
MVERYSNLKEEVDSSIPNYETSSPLDKKLVRWSIVSCALGLACRPFVSKKNFKKIKSLYKASQCDPTCTNCCCGDMYVRSIDHEPLSSLLML